MSVIQRLRKNWPVHNGKVNISERAQVEIRRAALQLTEDMLLKDGGNNLQTDSFQLLSDLKQRGNRKAEHRWGGEKT